MEPAAENVSDVVFRRAAERPDAPAIVDGAETLSYAGFAWLIAKATVYLKGLGVAPGDRVAVALTNSADHLILVFALFRLGAVLVEVPSLSEPGYRAELIRKFGVKLALLEAGGEALPSGVATERIELTWRALLEPLEGDHRHGEGEAPCAIVLSSGSTGTPTGRILSHDGLLRHYRGEATMAVAGIVSASRPCPVLIPLSISYGGFFGATMATLIAGCSAVILPKFIIATDMIRTIASWKDAVLPATPDMCRVLIANAPKTGWLLPRLRSLISMGQPLFAEEKRALVERVTPNLYDTYGAVGTGSIAYLGPGEMLSKGTTVGRPIAGVVAEIVDAGGTPVPPGALGQLRARRPGRAPLFDGDPVRQGEAAEWVYPGEVARFDEDGYLEIKGRTADLVRRRGVEIFPPEVEAALTLHPAVQDAAVIGLPLRDGDAELVAFVVKSAPVEHEALVRHCVDILPSDKRPNRVFYLDTLPRLGTGKIDRVRLTALAAGKT